MATILIAPLLTFLIQNRSFVRSFFRSFIRSFCHFLRPLPPRRGPGGTGTDTRGPRRGGSGRKKLTKIWILAKISDFVGNLEF